jgi:hypothetical protein
LLIRLFKTKSYLNGILAGWSMGIAVLIRYTNVVPLGLFILLWTISYAQGSSEVKSFFATNIKLFLSILIGGLPFLIFFLILNSYLYGSPFRSGYSISHEEIFLLGNIFKYIWGFVISLLLIYPGMLIGSLLIKGKEKWIYFIPFISTLLLYSACINSLFEGRILDLIIGIRFIVPVIPFLLIPYAKFLNQFTNHKYFKPVAMVMIILLIISTFGINFIHQRFLKESRVEWMIDRH